MSLHRKVWYKAVEANQIYQSDQKEGEEKFEELLEKYPDDGMVYYEKAEAYETMGLLNIAKKNYSKAYENFPLPHWK